MIEIVENQSEPLELCAADKIVIAPGKSAVLVERSLNGECTVEVGENARLRHYRLHCSGESVLAATVAARASYELTTLHLGGGGTHVRMDLTGAEARCRSDAVYAVSGAEQARLSSDIRHSADDTFSAQLVKGIAADGAKASFEGSILIPPGRRGIDGAQQHRALLLSPAAEIRAVPKLEIYSDDVKCAHGSAIGALNELHLFYLRTRGIPEPQAREILIAAFLNEVLDEITDEQIRAEFRNRVAEQCRFSGAEA